MVLLTERARTRAWRRSHRWSIGTFFGLLWLAATGTAGGFTGAALYSGDSFVLGVAMSVAGTILGIVVGYAVVFGMALPLIARRQRNEARHAYRDAADRRDELERAIVVKTILFSAKAVADAQIVGWRASRGIAGTARIHAGESGAAEWTREWLWNIGQQLKNEGHPDWMAELTAGGVPNDPEALEGYLSQKIALLHNWGHGWG